MTRSESELDPSFRWDDERRRRRAKNKKALDSGFRRNDGHKTGAEFCFFARRRARKKAQSANSSGQRDRKRRPAPRQGGDADLAAVLLHDLATDCQAEPCPA